MNVLKKSKADKQGKNASVAVLLPPSVIAPPPAVVKPVVDSAEVAKEPPLTEPIATIKVAIAEAEAKLAAAKTELTAAKSELTAAKVELSMAEKSGDQNSIADAKRDVNRVREEVESLSKSRNTAQARVDRLTESLSLAEVAARPAGAGAS